MLTVLAAAATAVALIAAPAAFAGDALIALSAHATKLDAFDGQVVWSQWDPFQNAYVLVKLDGMFVRRLPVAPRSIPFDVDLGPDPDGNLAAVYSRCTREPTTYWELDGRHGCDIYEFSFGTNGERKLEPAGSRTDEYFPTVWRNRVAFTRTYRAPARATPRRLTYWRHLSGGSARRLRSGHGRTFVTPHDLDMRGKRVALVWQGDFGAAEIRLSSIDGRPHLISTVPGSGAAAIEYSTFGSSLGAGEVYWFVDQSGEIPYLAELRRHATGSRYDERAQVALDESIDTFAQDGEVAYYALPMSGNVCTQILCLHELHRLDGLTFERTAPLPLR
jgi:hypothetical protein